MKKNATRPRARGKQDYQTPREFLDAIEQRFGPIVIDLAASPGQEVCPKYISPEQDSLQTEWNFNGVAWLNPPFSKFGEFSEKCRLWTLEMSKPHYKKRGSIIVMLTLLSGDAQWWKHNVRGKARTEAISPRITFVGEEFAYPKPLNICVYDPRFPEQPDALGYWRWKP